MVEPLALKDHTGESRIYFERAVLGFGLLIFLTLFLVARLFYLQIVQHNVYTTLSDKNRIQVQSLPPIRGLIYDSSGELIADNIPYCSPARRSSPPTAHRSSTKTCCRSFKRTASRATDRTG